jgi:hypothetical protein
MNTITLVPAVLIVLPAALLSSCGAPPPGIKAESSVPILKAIGQHQGQVEMVLANGTHEGWSFQGYGAVLPLYSQEVRDDEGWKSGMLGWCGTGLDEHVLEPGSSVSFFVTPEAQEMRIIVTLTASDGSQRVVRSPSISAH